MGLMLNSLPNPQQQIESLQRELYQRNTQLAEAEEALRIERVRSAGLEQGVAALRVQLRPLHQALLMVFGEINAINIDDPTPSNGASAKNSAVWEDWKKKLGGAAAKIIDILHLHGQLDQTQIRIHLGTSRMQTVYDAVSKLNKAGIINKNGGKVSLKDLR